MLTGKYIYNLQSIYIKERGEEMKKQEPQEYVFDYLRKSLEKSFDEMNKEYGSGGIPNTPETQEKLKDMANKILKGE